MRGTLFFVPFAVERATEECEVDQHGNIYFLFLQFFPTMGTRKNSARPPSLTINYTPVISIRHEKCQACRKPLPHAAEPSRGATREKLLRISRTGWTAERRGVVRTDGDALPGNYAFHPPSKRRGSRGRANVTVRVHFSRRARTHVIQQYVTQNFDRVYEYHLFTARRSYRAIWRFVFVYL